MFCFTQICSAVVCYGFYSSLWRHRCERGGRRHSRFLGALNSASLVSVGVPNSSQQICLTFYDEQGMWYLARNRQSFDLNKRCRSITNFHTLSVYFYQQIAFKKHINYSSQLLCLVALS